MGKGTVEVFDQHVAVGQVLHRFIALAHCHRHFSLTHIAANQFMFLRQVLLDVAEDAVEICLIHAKACGAEQEHLFALQLLQKLGGFGIAAALIGPKAYKHQFCLHCLCIGCAKIAAILLRQCCANFLRQLLGISGGACIYNRILHFHLPSCIHLNFKYSLQGRSCQQKTMNYHLF